MKTLAVLFVATLIVTQSAVAESLVIDKTRSSIEAAVKATGDSFTAKLSAYEAEISTGPSPSQIAAVQVKFRFADVKTGKDKRDVEMHHWQQTDKFPDCVYVLEKLTPADGGKFTATGKFTLHGITKAISFPVTISSLPDGSCKLDSEFPLDTQDYGLVVFKKFAILKVQPVLKIKFHLEGKLATAGQ